MGTKPTHPSQQAGRSFDYFDYFGGQVTVAPWQIVSQVTNLSAITVVLIFAMVTEMGVNRTEGTFPA